MKLRTAIGTALLVASSIASFPVAAKEKADPGADHVYGPDPGWAKFREIGEQAVAARLIDPESARISWSTGYGRGMFKPLLEARVYGYIACGTVNARNRMGGYTGATTFVVVIDFDRPLFVSIDQRAGGIYAGICNKDIAEGRLPPVPAEAAAVSAGATDAAPIMTATGFAVRAMPEGAYVSAVRPGSIAATAGLTAGMVVTAINGIPLAGMGDAMTKVVAAAGPGATIMLVDGRALTLGAAK